MIIQLEAFILEGPPSRTHLGILNRFDIILALFSLQVCIMYPRSIFGHVHTILPHIRYRPHPRMYFICRDLLQKGMSLKFKL